MADLLSTTKLTTAVPWVEEQQEKTMGNILCTSNTRRGRVETGVSCLVQSIRSQYTCAPGWKATHHAGDLFLINFNFQPFEFHGKESHGVRELERALHSVQDPSDLHDTPHAPIISRTMLVPDILEAFYGPSSSSWQVALISKAGYA